MRTNPFQLEEKVIAIKMLDIPEPDMDDPIQEPIKNTDEILNKARMEAELIRKQAKTEADALYAKIQQERDGWSREKQELTRKAQEEGYFAGWEEGKGQGYAEYAELINEARQIIISAKKEYTAYLDASEKIILYLGMKTAEKILAIKLSEDPESFLSLVKRALKEAKEFRTVQVQVHPNQYEYLRSQKDELLAVFSHETNLIIFPEADLPQNSCVIESGNGRIDASIDTQLSEIKQKLTELLESEVK